MARVIPHFTAAGNLVIMADQATFELVPRVKGEVVKVVVWKSECEAVDQGDEVAAFLAAFLKVPGIRLVRMSDDFTRYVGSRSVMPRTFQMAFNDRFPFLIISESSVNDLSEKIGREMTIRRFRPNIVLKGDMGPFDEDFWESLKIGESTFTLYKLCTRCKIPTVDPDTGVYDADNQPSVMLRKFRTVDGRMLFGQMAVCTRGEGTQIRVGDKVTVQSMYSERRY